jgi:hypothetical protein
MLNADAALLAELTADGAEAGATGDGRSSHPDTRQGPRDAQSSRNVDLPRRKKLAGTQPEHARCREFTAC